MNTRHSQTLEEIFQKRAEHLAKRGLSTDQSRSVFTALTLFIGDSSYGIPIDQVHEVIPFRSCMPIPGAPAEYTGVINVKNEIRAVLDLGVLLGTGVVSEGGFLVFIRRAFVEGRLICLHVDRLGEVILVDRSQLKPPISYERNSARMSIGVAADGTSILDLQRLYRTHLKTKSQTQSQLIDQGATS